MIKLLSLLCAYLLGAGCTVATTSTDLTSDDSPHDNSYACGACHEDEYTSWRGSRHAASASNPIFQQDFTHTPRQWCLKCHAPGATVSKIRFGDSDKDSGVGCLTCHLNELNQVMSARPPSAAGLRAHPMVLSPKLGSAEFCGRCHQFNFPRPGRIEPGNTPMQNTVEEWRTSDFGKNERPCQVCHMRGGDHRMPGAHDIEWLRKTVRIVVTRDGENISVRAESTGAGHAIPTGDVTRLILVHLCSEENCQNPAYSFRFGRSFTQLGDDWKLVDDTAIPPPATGRVASRTLSTAQTEELSEAIYWKAWFLYAPQLEEELPREQVRAELAQGIVSNVHED